MTSLDVVPLTFGKAYVQQTAQLVGLLKKMLPNKNRVFRKYYAEAVEEFESRWGSFISGKVPKLKIDELIRPTAIEIIYDLLISKIAKSRNHLLEDFANTCTSQGDSLIMHVGVFRATGLAAGINPGTETNNLGAVFSRRF